MTDDEAIVLVRTLAARLPEVTETTTFNNPSFQAGKKTFAVLDSYRGVSCVAFKATPMEQSRLTDTDARFFVAPYTGRHGWTCLRLDDVKDPEEVKKLVLQSYRLVATKRMLGGIPEDLR
jgi:predicted DNA-binding protein (MmcQ/YjbR family)